MAHSKIYTLGIVRWVTLIEVFWFLRKQSVLSSRLSWGGKQEILWEGEPFGESLTREAATWAHCQKYLRRTLRSRSAWSATCMVICLEPEACVVTVIETSTPFIRGSAKAHRILILQLFWRRQHINSLQYSALDVSRRGSVNLLPKTCDDEQGNLHSMSLHQRWHWGILHKLMARRERMSTPEHLEWPKRDLRCGPEATPMVAPECQSVWFLPLSRPIWDIFRVVLGSSTRDSLSLFRRTDSEATSSHIGSLLNSYSLLQGVCKLVLVETIVGGITMPVPIGLCFSEPQGQNGLYSDPSQEIPTALAWISWCFWPSIAQVFVWAPHSPSVCSDSLRSQYKGLRAKRGCVKNCNGIGSNQRLVVRRADFSQIILFGKYWSKCKHAFRPKDATMDMHNVMLSLSTSAWQRLCDVLSAQESGDGMGYPPPPPSRAIGKPQIFPQIFCAFLRDSGTVNTYFWSAKFKRRRKICAKSAQKSAQQKWVQICAP